MANVYVLRLLLKFIIDGAQYNLTVECNKLLRLCNTQKIRYKICTQYAIKHKELKWQLAVDFFAPKSKYSNRDVHTYNI